MVLFMQLTIAIVEICIFLIVGLSLHKYTCENTLQQQQRKSRKEVDIAT